MGADPDMIARQHKGTFATYIRGLTDRAVPMSFPFFALEKLPKASQSERDAIRDYSRRAYAEPLYTPTKPEEAAAPDPELPSGAPLTDQSDPLNPSPEL